MVLLDKKGFTVIEILITLFILTTLFSILYFSFNSLDVIKRSRDAKRLNDLRFLNEAIKNLFFNYPSSILANEYTIYLSLPDNNINCSSYSNLPQVFPPFSYRCASSISYLKTDGEGWLPINFSPSVFNISKLPIDPLNNSEYFYAFMRVGNRYKLTAKMESKVFSLEMIRDGGFEPLLFEIGNDLRIPNPQSGLILYLPFEEGFGTTTRDLSGYNNSGTLHNFNFNNSSGWVKGKIGWGLAFDGENDYLRISYRNILNVGSRDYTFSWMEYPLEARNEPIIEYNNGISSRWRIWHDPTFDTFFNGSLNNPNLYFPGVYSSTDKWYSMIFVWQKSIGRKFLYRDGNLVGTQAGQVNNEPTDGDLYIGTKPFNNFYRGILDEIRIYNRSLSNFEIEILHEIR